MNVGRICVREEENSVCVDSQSELQSSEARLVLTWLSEHLDPCGRDAYRQIGLTFFWGGHQTKAANRLVLLLPKRYTESPANHGLCAPLLQSLALYHAVLPP